LTASLIASRKLNLMKATNYHGYLTAAHVTKVHVFLFLFKM